jgi:hypothetical protein
VYGKHAHLIIIEDPIDPNGASSQAEILAAIAWMGSTLSQRKVNKAVTPTVLVMQRLATNDPAGHLLEKKKPIRHICLPAILSENVRSEECRANYHKVIVLASHPIVEITGTLILYLLDQNRIGADVIAEAKTDLVGDGFAGQYQRVPYRKGD